MEFFKVINSMVECLAYNEKVSGSNPLLLIKLYMGALTLKAYSDELREWELIEVEGIDPTDSFGVNLRLSIREQQIFLAEPSDPSIPWITNKGRLFFDGMFHQDISSDNNINWSTIFSDILEYRYLNDYLNVINSQKLSLFFVVESASIELIAMLYLLRQNCTSVDIRTLDKAISHNDFESSYQLAPSVGPEMLRKSTLGLLLNTDTRHEGYVLNLNLRQRFLKGGFKLLSIGSNLDLTFSTYTLGSNFNILKIIGEGSHVVCQDIKNAKFPLLITNLETLKRSDSKLVYDSFKYSNILSTAWGGVSVLSNNLSNSSLFTLNKFLPLSSDDLKFSSGLYFINTNLDSSSNFKKLISLKLLNLFGSLNSRNPFVTDQNVKKINFNAIQGLDQSSNYAYLPSNLIFEDNETYFNTQGVVKRVTKVIHFKKNAKSNWQLIRKLNSNLKTLGSLANVKDNSLIQFNCINSFDFKNYLYFQYYGVQSLTCLGFYLLKQNSNKSLEMFTSNFKTSKTKVLNTKVKYWMDDYFNNNGKDAFSYNSAALIKSSKILRESTTNFF